MTKAAELAKMGEVLTNSQIGGRRNMVINGAMQVAQRGTSGTCANSNTGYKSVDRWKFQESGADTYSLTMSQSTTAPIGFANSVKYNVDTADASLDAACLIRHTQTVEGQDLQQIKKGTSDAERITFSFHVRSSLTGTYIVEFRDADNNRICSKSYTISTADTWEYKTITFPADTTGAFDNDNAGSLEVSFVLAAGTNFSSGTLATAWESNTSANRAVGQVNFLATQNNEWYVTGVQLEVGSQATPFEHRSFGEELALCQRYHYRAGKAESAYTNFGQGWATSTTAGTIHVPLLVEMRSEPSVSVNDVQVSDDVNAAIDCSAVAVNAATGSRQLAVLEFTVSSGATQYRSYGLRGSNNTASHVSLDAEL
jgi:hypothetical protein